MVSVTQVPAAAATAALTLLYFEVEHGNSGRHERRLFAGAKITGIIWGAVAKATGALRVAPFVARTTAIAKFLAALKVLGFRV